MQIPDRMNKAGKIRFLTINLKVDFIDFIFVVS